MKILRPLALWAALATGLGLAPAFADEAGELVFAERGPRQLGDRTITWRLDVAGPATVEGFVPVTDGRIELAEAVDASDGEAVLELHEDTPHLKRTIGPYPVSGGDPALVFFLETTAREMARITGGSPFYIRNRIKDAVFRGGEVVEVDGTRKAVFRPFQDDKNKDRMAGFDTLELTFDVADPKQPISSMVAATSAEGLGFRISMVRQ
ncbi:hypothetical protein PE067_12180 [Paracoccus sp. DMF-8]|uniref:hypothetical protein n=1 Tax=Paracoccus sp. DMF-8 TaxID=3019445 RepID=UPI0023E83FBE|nr:hypothetical protein [Paracoccus sp. DMF-8]MDF3606818.1 hypothetical protein [Paracoccus sp. DMF-8]